MERWMVCSFPLVILSRWSTALPVEWSSYLVEMAGDDINDDSEGAQDDGEVIGHLM